MHARVQKWGNSLGRRIMSVKAGKLIVEAVGPALTVESLLDQVTPQNIHAEVSTGKRVGKEIWRFVRPEAWRRSLARL